MKIEIDIKDLKALAELVFLGELIINEERGDKRIAKYSRIKDKILTAYRVTLNAKDRAYLADEEKETSYYISKLTSYLVQYETAFLIYTLSSQFGELSRANGKKGCSDKITKWRGDSKQLLQKLC